MPVKELMRTLPSLSNQEEEIKDDEVEQGDKEEEGGDEDDEEQDNSMELQQCTLCSLQLEVSEYFTHGTEVHGIFSCLYCQRQFKFSKELMVHLNREHKVPTQKFSNGAEFLDRGGIDTSLLCVECNKVFQSDGLTTFMKYHAQECRKSTGICPKCGSVLLLSLLGEHIVQCQGSMNVNLHGSTTITTSQLRNRDNSCKYCGKKFSPSKIAAHIRACSVRTTKSFGNLWNSSSVTNKNNSAVEFDSSNVGEDSSLDLNTQSNKRPSISISKVKPGRKSSTINNSDVSLSLLTTSGPQSKSSAATRRKNQKNISISSSSSSAATISKVNNNNWKNNEPLSIAELSSSTSIISIHDEFSSSSSSTKKTLSKKKQQQLQSAFSNLRSPSKNLTIPSLHIMSPSGRQNMFSIQQQQDDEMEGDDHYDDYENEGMEQEEPVKLDPLLLELDDDKRLGILIRELSDKLKDYVSESSVNSTTTTSPTTTPIINDSPFPPPSSRTTRYELSVNYSLESKTEDEILNDMILKSSVDCAYCRLVRLIRIDKRQLVIHLLSKHSWDLRVFRTPAMVLKSIMESRNHLRPSKTSPEDDKTIIKQESTEDEASGTTTELLDNSTIKSSSPLDNQDQSNELEHNSTTDSKLPSLPPPSPTLVQAEKEDDKEKELDNDKPITTMVSSPTSIPPLENLGTSTLESNNCSITKEDDQDNKNVVDNFSTDSKQDFTTTSSIAVLPTFSSNDDDKPICDDTKIPQTLSPLTNQETPIPDDNSSSKDEQQEENSTKTNVDGDDEKMMIDTSLKKSETPATTSESSSSSDPQHPEEIHKSLSLSPLPPHPIDSSSELLLPEVKMEVDDDNDSTNKPSIPMKENCSNSSELTLLDKKEHDQVLDFNLKWIDFKLALLEKVFHSHNVVYTFTGEKLEEFGEIPCECLLCGFLADSQKNLFPHWRRIHRGVAMKCTMCKGRFLFAGALYSHLCLGTPEPLTLTDIEDDHEGSSDTIGWRYQCSICENQHLPGFFNYMVHIRSDHNKCELCLETLNTQKDLEHHMKKHKLNHFCWKCSVTYCAKPNFMTHLFWKHGTESVDCSKCLKKKWPHIYHFCVPPEYFVCDVCGLYFTKPKALIVHKRLHNGEKLRKCPKTSCQERFISKKLLQKHLDTVHVKGGVIDSVKPSLIPTPETLPAITEGTTTTNSTSELNPELNQDQDQQSIKDLNQADTQKESTSSQPTTDLNGHHDVDGQNINSSSDKNHSIDPPSEPMNVSSIDIKKEVTDANGDRDTHDSVDDGNGAVIKTKPGGGNGTTPIIADGDIKAETMLNGDDDAMSIDDDNVKTPPSETNKSMDHAFSPKIVPVVDSSTPVKLTDNDVTPPLPIGKVPDGDGNMDRQDSPIENLRAEESDVVGSPNPATKKFKSSHSSPEHLPVKPSKPFNLAEIQGPNLSEEESDSESDGLEEPKLQPMGNVTGNTFNSKQHDICNNHHDNRDPTLGSLFSSSSSFIQKQDGLLSDSGKLVGMASGVDHLMSESLTSSQKNDSLTSLLQQKGKTEPTLNQSTMDMSDGIGLEALDNFNDSMMERTGKPFHQSSLLLDDLDKLKQSDDSMSPLLPPLDDFNFSVPEIPTFEENHLPEHIIRENAMFSIQHEHDYCQPKNLGNPNLKRKVGASTNVYGNGHMYHGGDLIAKASSRSRGRPKKLKVRKPSKKTSGKKRRRRSYSSSSSSSSSCSSCGSNCSCSSSSSGSSSSSSSSNSDSSDNEGGRDKHHHSSKSKKSPIKLTIPKVKTAKGTTSKKMKKSTGSVAVGGKVVNNGVIKRPRGAPRKYKKAKVPKITTKLAPNEANENIKPLNPVEAEPYILESDLETDDSGSEEIFHQKQLTDIIGTVKPPIDGVWDMGSELFLLKLVRGVQNLEELRPPPPPPPRREEIKYSLKNSGAPVSKLKVRNVPIKPLIVKRNVHSNFNMSDYRDLTVVKDSPPNFGVQRPPKKSLKTSLKTSLGNNEKKNTTITITRGPSINSSTTAALPVPAAKKSKMAHKSKGSTTHFIKRSYDDSLSFTGHVAVGDDYHYQPPSIPVSTVMMTSSSDGQFSTPSTPTTPLVSTPTNKRAPRGSGGGRRSASGAAKVKPPLTKPKKADLYVDEKLYCICQCPHDNVSQMIGCDYKGCQYKWFHFECVGILIPPKGKWYCSECREIVRQKRAAKMKEEETNKQQQQQEEIEDMN